MIALTNLAFPAGEEEGLLPGLVDLGLRGLEVAPTRIAPWAELTPDRLAAYRARLVDMGLAIPSIQSIFFGVDGAALLGERASFERMRDHLRPAARIADALGAHVAVFGSPGQRKLNGLGEEEAFALGAERLRECAEVCAEEGGMIIGLEPVPPAYGCEFLNSWQSSLAMVKVVDHPCLRLHLDTGCVLLGEAKIEEAVAEGIDWTAHFQIAEPQLAGFADPVARQAEAAAALRAAGYAGWMSIEMKELPDWRAECARAVRFAAETYA